MCPIPYVGLASLRLYPDKRLPLRVVRVFAQEDLTATGDEQVCADAHPTRRDLLESQGRGMLHEPEKRTGARHELGSAHHGKGLAVQTDKSRAGVARSNDGSETPRAQVQATVPRRRPPRVRGHVSEVSGRGHVL